MQALKKAAKAVGSNKVHPTESQDADSEMAQPPRRRLQSRDITVAGNDSFMPPSILKIGASKNSPELRRPSFSLDAKHSPMSTARASPTLTSFRRRSLSNGSIGSETAGLREPGSGRDAAHSPVPHSSTLEDKSSIAAPRKDIQQIQSLALQRFFTSAEISNSWSAASKKMIFGSDIDDAKLQNRAKLENRSLFFCKVLTFCACLSALVACLTSRFEEDARNTMLSEVILQGVVQCCAALNITLDSEGSCPATLNDGTAACPPNNALLSTYDSDFVVAKNTTVYVQANAGRSLVSLLSIANVLLLFLLYVSKAQYQALLDHLERNNSLANTKRVIFPETLTVVQFLVESFILFAHLPPGDFESPVLIIESVFYGENRVLKYPWIALSSLWCTLRLYTVLRLARDITLSKWSSKKKLLERQSGVAFDTGFALKVMMAESPVFVLSTSFSFVWILCSYWMLVFERNHPDIRKYADAIWLSFVTASTVGYGDLFPLTLAGRFVSVVSGIIGIIVAAFGTAVLCSNLALTNSEFKVKNLISRGDMDRSMCVSAATYIQRFFRYKWRKPSPYASFWKPAMDITSASNEFMAAKRDYDIWIKGQVNLIISLKRMLEESETIMKFSNFLSNDTGESTKHFDLQKCGFGSLHEVEANVRELRDYLRKMWNDAPRQAKEIAEAVTPTSRDRAMGPSVDLSNYGNRIQSLAELCKDCNTDLESACISVQRSGVGFVNPRAAAGQPQNMQQPRLSNERHFPPQHQQHQQYQHHQHHQQSQQTQHYQPSALPPFQPPAQPVYPDLSATTQTVMQIANIKLMQKLIKVIKRFDSSDDSDGVEDSEFSEHDTDDRVHRATLARPVQSAALRPSSALSLPSRPSSALSHNTASSAFDSRVLQRQVAAANRTEWNAEAERPRPSAVDRGPSASSRPSSRPLSAAGVVAGDEARSRGARYIQ